MPKIILIFFLLIEIASAQNSNFEAFNSKNLKGKFEIGFTPGFTYFKDYKIRDNDTGYYSFQSRFSMLTGYEVHKNFYINALIDYHYAKSNVSFFPTYKAFTFGIQYKYKFLNDFYQSKILKLYGKSFRIRFYPELFTTFAISNFHQEKGQLPSADTKFKHFQFAIGTGLPIYLNKHFNLQLNWQIQYNPSEFDHYFYYRTIQTQLIYKL